jgi:hypothetical protein
MSEQNILNPTITSPFNSDYPLKFIDPAVTARYQARGGKPYFRTLAARGLTCDLVWGNRLNSDADALLQWCHQYEKDFFSIADYDTGRYYSGMFADQPQIERMGNNKVNITAQFIVVPGLAQFQYPSRWGVDSIFLEERDGFGSDVVKVTGTWTFFSGGAGGINLAHGANQGCYRSSTTNDIAEWSYFGYGFRLWSPKEGDYGIGEVSLDGVVLGTYDGFNAIPVTSSALFTQLNVALGLHRVKLRCTGTKNAGSTGPSVIADAIEVMR